MVRKLLKDVSPLWLLVGFALFLLWHTPIIYPLKLFVVFMHELSHGLMAFATDGTFSEMAVRMNESGYALSRGGSSFLVLSAGYLGSLVWGGLILIIAARTRYDRALSTTLGLIMLVATLFFTRNVFGFVFGLCFGVALFGLGWYVRNSVNDVILRLMGFATCIYAVFDIFSDTLRWSGQRSDARMLAELTGIPTLIWGALWIGIAGIGTLFFLSLAGKKFSAGEEAKAEQGGIAGGMEPVKRS